MKWFAPAKINLSLRVLGRRDDGFHEIETLMVPISLADELVVESGHGAAGSIELTCSDPTIPTGVGNLAFRAAELFISRVGTLGSALRLVLDKRIPHGAGLGGGSSDAAAVLLALNDLYAANLTMSQLSGMAAELGSDVPFFIYRSAAVCRGRGERVEPVALNEAVPLLLLRPPFPVPTPLAYQRWHASRKIPGSPYASQNLPWGVLVNDLERPVFEKYFLLAEMKTWLLGQPVVAGALMSGSGSTVFGVLRSSAEAQSLARRAQAEFGEIWTCECTTVMN